MAAVAMVGACADDPVAVRLDVQDVNVSTPEDTAFVVQVPVDSNRPVQASVTTQPAHGVITDLGSSTYSYTPAKDYNGPDTIAITFNNGTTTVVGTAHITVTPVDDVPVAGADSFAAGFSATLVTPVATLLANDTDIEQDPLTVTEVSAASHGTVTLNGGNVTFVPEPNYQGAAGYAYRLSDGTLSSLGNVLVTVGTNNAPVAGNDTVAGTEDTNAVVQAATLLANDTDGDQQTLSVSAVHTPTHGTVTKTGNAITFVPDANYNGPATFKYTVTDGAANIDATVTINVAPVNDAPVIVNDSGFTTTEDAQLTFTAGQLLGNDSDIDNDTLRIVSVAAVTGCTVSLPAAAVGDTVLFTPTPNFNGAASFTYTVSDGTTTGTGTVSVTVGAVNDAPVAVDDTMTGPEDSVISVGTAALLANDTDADADVLSITAVSNPSTGTVTLAGGMVSFTPPANFNGTATFDYTVSDGALTDTGTVTVTVTAVNDAPNAIDDVASTPEDVAISINVLVNDLDIDGPALTILSTTQPAHGTVVVVNNQALYTPAANYFGPDSFTYVATDGGLTSTALVTITVVSANDPPLGVNDMVGTPEDTAITIDAVVNDTDADGDTLAVATASQPAHGTTQVINGQVLYTPALNYNGPDAFTYTVTDGHGGTGSAMVSIVVGPVNDAPVAVDDLYVVNDIAAISAPGVLINDSDVDSAPLTAVLVQAPSSGILVLNADGSFTYEPDTCSFDEFFTYQVSDGLTLSNIATVTLTINHTPVANPDYYTTDQNVTLTVPSLSPLSFGVLDNDFDPDPQPITAQLATLPQHAQSFVLNPDGSFIYVPEVDFTGNDSFTYTTADQTTVSAPTTVTITVSCPNFHGGSNGCVPALVAPDPAFVQMMDAVYTAARPICCYPQKIAALPVSAVLGCDYPTTSVEAIGASAQQTGAAQ
ncbi:MAG: tandem-95 repeat protein [Myxococcales bacterium]|nr:tandem-95 repeat protein [Myxococcales bacterium]